MNPLECPSINQVLNENKRSLPVVKEAVREAAKHAKSLSDKIPTNDIERFIIKYGSLYSDDHFAKGMTVNQITDLVIQNIEKGNLL
ncbi:MAG: hypothetical protein KAU41_00520 [Deltaproteobacteria bacterium]|nr:hypothetical protein [Deltaproteobacteria bacterium]